MRFISWNVNGLRAVLKKGGFEEWVQEEKPDVLALQETKAHPDQVNLNLEGYKGWWNSAKRKGYSGTAIFCRETPEKVQLGLGKEELDQEGRVITAEWADFFLVNVYTPNSQTELRRLDYRVQEWDPAFRAHLKKLEKKKPVIFCGDLNVAHQEIDIARPDDNRRSAGFTDEERESFTQTLNQGYIDSFRHFCQEGGHYSYWSYRIRGRERNVGWRLDYFGVSQKLKSRMKNATIRNEIMGSDHCPVELTLD